MTLNKLVSHASAKERFQKLEDFVAFATDFLEFSASGLQAVIVSRNEPYYNFWQFKKDGSFNVSRPINSNLMYSAVEAGAALQDFLPLLAAVQESGVDSPANRLLLNRAIYTLQQCIGIALDARSGSSNPARKILPGHFKGYTVKLNPLDGVYYFDIRPNMRTEAILKDHIRTFDHFLFNDVWSFLGQDGVPAKIE